MRFVMPGGRQVKVLAGAAVLLLLSLVLIERSLTRTVRADLDDVLSSVLQTTERRLDVWAAQHARNTDHWADNAVVIRAAQSFLPLATSRAALLAAPEQAALRSALGKWLVDFGYRGFFVVAPDGTSLASFHDDNIGEPNPVLAISDQFARILAGETLVSRPLRADVDSAPTQFSMAPVRDSSGAVLAVFMLRIDPGQAFSPIFREGRSGHTGESYAFDREGRMVSESRFLEHLRDVGLIAGSGGNTLAVDIRDPGVDLTTGGEALLPRADQPLTRMARAAIADGPGRDLGGYRDYRGVPVIGVWTWHSGFDMGITTEIDVAEAYGARDGVLRVFYLFAAALFLMVAAVVVVAERARGRLQALQQVTESERDRANDANRAKSLFLSSMSHELRTPLNAVLGFSQLLEMKTDPPLDEEQAQYVQEIESSGAHLLRLIQDILDLSSIEAGRVNLSLEPVDLNLIISDCVSMLRALAVEADVLVEYRAGAPDVPLVNADLVRLKQVVINLLSNAIKYNRPGGTVVVSVAEEPRGVILLTFADTGIGIDPQALKSIWTPFDRAGAEASNIEGTGIGLSITRQLVRHMQGEIRVESELGLGSTFHVTLPAVDTGTVSHRAAAAQAGDMLSVDFADFKGRRILYIEDNVANRKLMKAVFGVRTGIEYTVATSGEAGVSLAQTFRPDLILLDLNMPGMDGYDVLEALRRDPLLRKTPVIATSANVGMKAKRMARAAGFDAFVAKPVDLVKLHKVIGKHLARRAANKKA